MPRVYCKSLMQECEWCVRLQSEYCFFDCGFRKSLCVLSVECKWLIASAMCESASGGCDCSVRTGTSTLHANVCSTIVVGETC